VATESQDGRRGYKAILDQRPLAVVIDLSIRPTHGRELARSLRKTKPTRSLPVVFVGGSPREDAKVRVELPGALFTTLEGLVSTLEQAIKTGTPKDLG
jgi:DNA-binding response OmpR family regulator